MRVHAHALCDCNVGKLGTKQCVLDRLVRLREDRSLRGMADDLRDTRKPPTNSMTLVWYNLRFLLGALE